MGKWKGIVNTVVFILFLFGAAVFNIIRHNKEEIAEREQRTLAGFPEITWETLTDGSFAEGVDAYISDRVPFREKITKIGVRIENLRGLSGEEQVELVTVKRGDQFTAHIDTEPSSPDPGTDLEAREEDNETESAAEKTDENGPEQNDPKKTDEAGSEKGEAEQKEAQVNEVLIVGDKGVEVTQVKMNLAYYFAQSAHGFLAKLDHPVRAFAAFIPTHISFMEKYAHLGADQREGIRFFYQALGETVSGVDAFSALEAHKDEYIYFRTDHHWTALGAYYVYREFCRTAGFDPVPLERYETVQIPDFWGSMYSYTLNDRLAANPDTITAYLPFVDYEYWVYWDDVGTQKEVIDLEYAADANKYQIFISSDRQLAIIKNDVPTERKILVFKDSYANAFIPFLMPHYKEVHIIDPRYYKHNAVQYCNRNKIDDVLFFNYFGVVAAAEGYAWYLQQVTNYPYDAEE